jgi:hypothetical protein
MWLKLTPLPFPLTERLKEPGLTLTQFLYPSHSHVCVSIPTISVLTTPRRENSADLSRLDPGLYILSHSDA